MAQNKAGQSTDEEPLHKIFDDAMKVFDSIEKGNEATNSNTVQVSSFIVLWHPIILRIPPVCMYNN